MRAMVTTLGALALAGCSIGADVPVAEKAIGGFHTQLNAAQFEPIFAGSASEMKKLTTQPRLTAFLAAVHRKLGLFKSGKAIGWNANINPGGHYITVNYQAAYERGAAAENFVYRIEDGKAALVGYHVDAEALVLN